MNPFSKSYCQCYDRKICVLLIKKRFFALKNNKWCIYKKWKKFLYTHMCNNYTTKKQLTKIIVQRANVNVAYGTNIYLFVLFIIVYLFLKTHKRLKSKMFMVFIDTHIHNCYITKKQLISSIFQRDIVNVAYGTN